MFVEACGGKFPPAIPPAYSVDMSMWQVPVPLQEGSWVGYKIIPAMALLVSLRAGYQ